MTEAEAKSSAGCLSMICGVPLILAIAYFWLMFIGYLISTVYLPIRLHYSGVDTTLTVKSAVYSEGLGSEYAPPIGSTVVTLSGIARSAEYLGDQSDLMGKSLQVRIDRRTQRWVECSSSQGLLVTFWRYSGGNILGVITAPFALAALVWLCAWRLGRLYGFASPLVRSWAERLTAPGRTVAETFVEWSDQASSSALGLLGLSLGMAAVLSAIRMSHWLESMDDAYVGAGIGVLTLLLVPDVPESLARWLFDVREGRRHRSAVVFLRNTIAAVIGLRLVYVLWGDLMIHGLPQWKELGQLCLEFWHVIVG